MDLDLILFGDPIPKGRPRMGPSGHAYTPERTRAGERAVTAVVIEAMDGHDPITGPVSLEVEFHCATKRRTDGDNLLKLVTDSMNKVVYEDDSQIVAWTCRLYRGVGKKNAKTVLKITALEDAVPSTQ